MFEVETFAGKKGGGIDRKSFSFKNYESEFLCII